MLEATPVVRRANRPYATDVTKQTFDREYSVDSVIVTLSLALAFYNSLEMVLLILTTFKKYKGLYFWSLVGCNLGVVLYTLGVLLGYFELCVLWLGLVIDDVGWTVMLTFQSLVLYSRLGLILHNSNVLAAVKWMIIFDSSVLCTIVVILNLGNEFSGTLPFAKGYYYIEQIQLIWFTVQELIISGIYIWQTRAWLKVALGANTRTVIWQLFVLNVIIIAMDIALVTLQYLHYQLYQEAIKAFVYSVKLKLELNILSKLVDLVTGRPGDKTTTLDVIDSASVPGQADLQRELSGKSVFHDFAGFESGNTTEKTSTANEYRLSNGISHSPSDKGVELMHRVASNHSRLNSRVSGRESDIMYADMLRSMG